MGKSDGVSDAFTFKPLDSEYGVRVGDCLISVIENGLIAYKQDVLKQTDEAAERPCEHLSRDVDRRILDDVIFEMHMFLESDGELYVGKWYEALTSLNLYLEYDD